MSAADYGAILDLGAKSPTTLLCFIRCHPDLELRWRDAVSCEVALVQSDELGFDDRFEPRPFGGRQTLSCPSFGKCDELRRRYDTTDDLTDDLLDLCSEPEAKLVG